MGGTAGEFCRRAGGDDFWTEEEMPLDPRGFALGRKAPALAAADKPKFQKMNKCARKKEEGNRKREKNICIFFLLEGASMMGSSFKASKAWNMLGKNVSLKKNS